ncbi:hypothetical protein P9112_003406 [Eukaryota sp. TZLM1-RC]
MSSTPPLKQVRSDQSESSSVISSTTPPLDASDTVIYDPTRADADVPIIVDASSQEPLLNSGGHPLQQPLPLTLRKRKASSRTIPPKEDVQTKPQTKPKTPSSTSTITTPKAPTKSRGKSSTGKREGLEETTQRILRLAQVKGSVLFKDLHNILDIDYRRAYDILNILQTTPLIHKGSTKVDGQYPFTWCEGTPLPEAIEIDTLNDDLTNLNTSLHNSLIRCHRMELLLANGEDCDLEGLFTEFLDEELPSELQELYTSLI